MRIPITFNLLREMLSEKAQADLAKHIEEFLLNDYDNPGPQSEVVFSHAENAGLDIDINALWYVLTEEQKDEILATVEKLLCEHRSKPVEDEKPAAPPAAAQTFEQMRVRELRGACRKAGIPYTKLVKVDMIAALQAKTN